MKNVVVIGGGTGLSRMLRGIKQLDDTKLSAIVTVADDGGSTGRLREQFHIPAMGDVRNVMYALAEEETLFTELMNFRFKGSDQDVGGHSFGNLLLTALTETRGSFLAAIQTLSKVLNVKGEIIPSTLQTVTLYAEMEDGTVVRGESNIPSTNNRIRRITYHEKVHATDDALRAIREADIIIYGIGSLYTSIVPNLIIEDLLHALQESTAPKIYFCNTMTQPGETTGYSLEDHVEALQAHSFPSAVDTVITFDNALPNGILARYKAEGSVPVICKEDTHPYQVLKRDLISTQDGYIRHSANKVCAVVAELLAQLT